MARGISRREAIRTAFLALPVALVSRARPARAAESAALPAAPQPLGATSAARATGASAFEALAPSPPAAGPAPAAPEPVAPRGEGDHALPELYAGMAIGRCTVVSVGAVAAGGVPVIMKSPDGTLFGVDVLRHDRLTPGVSRGGRLAVYMNNGGKGSTATIEEHGLGAMALAQWLAHRETLGHPVPALLTLRQRAPLLAAARG